MENNIKDGNTNARQSLTGEQEETDRRFTEMVKRILGDPEEPRPIAEYVDEAKTEQNVRLYDLPRDPEQKQSDIPITFMRTYNCLRRGRCESLADVLDIIEWNLLPGMRNINQRCVENAIDICLYFCPNETKRRVEIANTNKDRLLRLQEKCKSLLLSETQQELLNKPIEEVIPQNYLEEPPLFELKFKTFRDLCNVIANGGDYHTELWGERNLFNDSVSIYLIKVLQICEDILTK